MPRSPLARFSSLIQSHAFARAWGILRADFPERPAGSLGRLGVREQALREALLDRASLLLASYPKALIPSKERERYAHDSIHMRWQSLHHKLILDGVDPLAVLAPRAPNPLSLLELCCQSQDSLALELLLESDKMRPEVLWLAREGSGMASPLLSALTTQWINGLEVMLRVQGVPNLCQSAPGASISPLIAACTLGRSELVGMLLRAGVDSNARETQTGEDALGAAFSGFSGDGSSNAELLNIIESLLEAGFDFPGWAKRHRVYDELEAIPALFEPYAKAISIAEHQEFSAVLGAQTDLAQESRGEAGRL